ncbi:ferredoxin reductase-like protein [Hanseniaspora valbyensis NRRL Y-1626]|uniref:NADH-cytochrome b5 reductase n=1 Tax=Hanseniaspora valbyensis NRRL Y-1626 TaxID=766949 RepID=A0A1B7TE55_9ASCO|nr:ferredoxin reductase-like protein [Hanseniaspora valbyensis NRRL Y-1626]
MLKSKYLFPTLASAVVVSAAGVYLYQNKEVANSLKSFKLPTFYKTVANESTDNTKALLGDGNWVDLKLSKIEQLSHDTKRFTFAFDDENKTSGLKVASCILAKYVTPKGSNVIRPYTPTSDIDEKGSFDLVIKRYPDGKFGTHIHSLKEGDTVAFKGPILKWDWTPNAYKEVVLIGGGTGITPLYQIIHQVTKNPEDKTKIKLFYGNKTEEDILLKKELDSIAAKYPGQFEVKYYLDSIDESKKDFKKGFITKEDLSSVVKKENHVFVCGPPPFMKAFSGPKKSPSDQGEVTGVLSELGLTKDEVFKF